MVKELRLKVDNTLYARKERNGHRFLDVGRKGRERMVDLNESRLYINEGRERSVRMIGAGKSRNAFRFIVSSFAGAGAP